MQWGIAYAAAAWVLLQGAGVLRWRYLGRAAQPTGALLVFYQSLPDL